MSPWLRTLVPTLSTIVLVFENSSLADLTVGRSSVRQRILALLMASPADRLHLREIQRRAGTSPGTASRELAKLVAAGLIEREAEGNQVYFRASTSPFATMLRSLLVAVPEADFKARPSAPPGAKSRPPAEPTAAAPGSAESEVPGRFASEEIPAASEKVALDPSVAPSPAVSDRVAHDAEPHEPAVVGSAARAIRTGPEIAEWSVPPLAAAPTQAGPAMPATSEPSSPTQAATSSSGASQPAPAVGGRAGVPVRPVASEHAASPDPLGLMVAARLAREIRSIYGDVLRGVYLYGARASGPAAADQDVETIVVLDRIDRYGEELERTSHACAALSHELGLVVSRVFVSEATWNGDPAGIPPRVRAGAVAV